MRILIILAASLLFGCSNSVEENQGALRNILIKGTVLNGNVRDAKVQLVGIDQYGQPQRDSNGEFLGDIYYTDEAGAFSASIQGAYTGPLLAVIKYDQFEQVVTPATESNNPVTEIRSTQIRCALTNGCLNETGQVVSYGEWYDVSEDFELWSLVNEAQSLTQLHVSPFTHLAAKLAFSEFQWDGTGTCNAESCDGAIAINSMITPQKIHEANTRVQGIFGFETNIANYIKSFTPLGENEERIDSQDQSKHGLFNLAWQYRTRETNSRLMAVLDNWLSQSFLFNQGQLFEKGGNLAPTQWDLFTLYSDAIAIHAELNIEDTNLSAAVNSIQSNIAMLNEVKTDVKGGTYSESLAEKINQARETVVKVQGWLLDYENKYFEHFFDVETADQIDQIEQKWETFQETLAPELHTVFSPMMQLAEYALLCLSTQTSTNTCTASDTYVLQDSSAQIIFNSSDRTFIYESNLQPQTNIEGRVTIAGEKNQRVVFTFTKDIRVENNRALAVVHSGPDDYASIQVELENAIEVGVQPNILTIDLTWPKLTLKAKDIIDGGFQDLVYSAEDITASMVGVTDPWIANSPTHFNIESVNIPGKLTDGDSRIILDAAFNSSNAHLYYAPTRFPDMNFVWKSADIKRYMRFEDGALDNAHIAGWLGLPSNVVEGETLSAAVEYIEVDNYESLDETLKNELALDNLFTFEFGALTYPGGSTGLAIYKQSAGNNALVKQCEESNGDWRCSQGALLADLGCETRFSSQLGFSQNASVAEAFLFLKNDENSEGVGCIPQVKIVGRGVYKIEYGLMNAFNQGDVFDVTLVEPIVMGLASFSVRLISNGDDSGSSPIYFNVTGALTDEDNVNLLISLTHGYYGVGDSGILGLEAIIPFGERTLWFLLGKDESEQSDALVYLILDDQIELTMTAFDYAEGYEDHSQPLGYLRYDETLVGTVSKESGKFVVRYVDGTWQLL